MAVRIWKNLRAEAGGGFGPAPVKRADVSDELNEHGVDEPSERLRIRELVRAFDGGFESGRQPPTDKDKKKEKAASKQDAADHFVREYRAQQREGR